MPATHGQHDHFLGVCGINIVYAHCVHRLDHRYADEGLGRWTQGSYTPHTDSYLAPGHTHLSVSVSLKDQAKLWYVHESPRISV